MNDREDRRRGIRGRAEGDSQEEIKILSKEGGKQQSRVPLFTIAENAKASACILTICKQLANALSSWRLGNIMHKRGQGMWRVYVIK